MFKIVFFFSFIPLHLFILFKSWIVLDSNLTDFFNHFQCLISSTYKSYLSSFFNNILSSDHNYRCDLVKNQFPLFFKVLKLIVLGDLVEFFRLCARLRWLSMVVTNLIKKKLVLLSKITLAATVWKDTDKAELFSNLWIIHCLRNR